jgi:hypothetical protein
MNIPLNYLAKDMIVELLRKRLDGTKQLHNRGLITDEEAKKDVDFIDELLSIIENGERIEVVTK